jgi:hypothetical protein
MKTFPEPLMHSKILALNPLLFVSKPFRVIMKRFFVVAVTFLLLATSQQTSAQSDNLKTWNEVISEYSDTGTLGGVSISLDSNLTNNSNTMMGDEWPSLIEVYTATWCINCVTTQNIIDSLSISEEESMMKIHYHRFFAETQDPFGSQKTDERWIDRYGPTSRLTTTYEYENIAPSKVFDGERLHTGTTKFSESLEIDYQTSLDKGPSIDISTLSATLSWTNLSGSNDFSWNISTPSLSDKYTIEPMIFIIEDEAYFPEGGNGEKYYHHILRDIIFLSSVAGNISSDFNMAYDGDDISAVLVFDWNYDNPDDGLLSALPFPSAVVFVSLGSITVVIDV